MPAMLSFTTKQRLTALFFVLFFLLLPTISIQAATQGPNTATATGDCINDSGTGTAVWTTPGNAFSTDTTYATISVDGTISNYIKCTDFGFNIPAGATIDGIQVGVERQASATNNGGVVDSAIRVVKGGSIGSTDRKTTTVYTTSNVTENHGATNDLWGTTWTVSDINASDFGAAVAVTKASSGGAAITASVDSISITVTYTPVEPDLTASLTDPIAGNTYAIGDTIDFSGVVENTLGDADAPLSYAGFCIDDADCSGGYIWDDFQIDPLATGATAPTTPFTWTITGATAPGNHNVYFCADAKVPDDVTESNENNNCSSAVVITVTAAPLPDLVTNFISGPGSGPFRNGDTLSLTWTVTNQGTSVADAPASFAGFCVNDPTCSGGFVDSSYAVGAVAQGATSADITITWNASTGNNQIVYFCADALNDINEEGGNNNCSQSGAIDILPPRRPDLVTSFDSADLSTVQIGNPVQLTWNVSNSGGETAAPGTTAGYCVNDSDCSGGFDGTVGVGGIQETDPALSVSFSWTPDTVGNGQVVTFCADHLDIVDELDDSVADNCADSDPIDVTAVPRPDLTATLISGPGAGSFTTGDQVSVTWSVANTLGTDSAPASAGGFCVNDPDCSGGFLVDALTLSDMFSVDPLAIGETSTDITITWDAVLGNNQTLYFCADSLTTMTELSEGNNCSATALFSVVPPLAPVYDPSIPTYDSSIDPIAIGESVTFTGTITNSGGPSTGAIEVTFCISNDYSNPPPSYVDENSCAQGLSGASGLFDGSITINSIAAGASTDVTATLDTSSLNADTYRVYLCADIDNTVDNCTVSSVFTVNETDKPELITGSLTRSPIPVIVGDDVTFTGVVENLGQLDAAASKAVFCISDNVGVTNIAACTNGLNGGSGLIGFEVPVQALVVGQSVTKTSNIWEPVRTGDYILYFCADIDNEVTPEVDETNNCSAAASFTVAAATRPDFVTLNFDSQFFEGPDFNIGETMLFSGDVKNKGTISLATTSVYCVGPSVSFDASNVDSLADTACLSGRIGTYPIGRLQTGASSSTNATWVPTVAGTYNVYFCAGTGSALDEGNSLTTAESNNCSATTVTVVAAPLPDITSVSVERIDPATGLVIPDSEPIITGTPVTFSAITQNDGEDMTLKNSYNLEVVGSRNLALLTSSYNYSGGPYPLAVNGGYVYVMSKETAGSVHKIVLRSYNVATPSSITLGDAVDFTATASGNTVNNNNIIISGNSLYSGISFNTTGELRDLMKFNISNPLNIPAPSGAVVTPAGISQTSPSPIGAEGIARYNNFIFAVSSYLAPSPNENTLQVYDTNNNPFTAAITPRNLNLAQDGITLDSEYQVRAITISGDYAYIVRDNGGGDELLVYFIANPLNPIRMGGRGLASYIAAGSEAHNISVRGQFAYIMYASGIVIVNISNPQALTVVTPAGSQSVSNTLANHSNAGDFAILGQTLFTAKQRVYDLSNISVPIKDKTALGGLYLGNTIEINNDKLYSLSADNKIVVFEPHAMTRFCVVNRAASDADAAKCMNGDADSGDVNNKTNTYAFNRIGAQDFDAGLLSAGGASTTNVSWTPTRARTYTIYHCADVADYNVAGTNYYGVKEIDTDDNDINGNGDGDKFDHNNCSYKEFTTGGEPDLVSEGLEVFDDLTISYADEPTTVVMEGITTLLMAAAVHNISGVGTTDDFETNFTYAWHDSGVWDPATASWSNVGLNDGNFVHPGGIAGGEVQIDDIPLANYMPERTGILYIQHCVDSSPSTGGSDVPGDVDEGVNETPNCSLFGPITVVTSSCTLEFYEPDWNGVAVIMYREGINMTGAAKTYGQLVTDINNEFSATTDPTAAALIAEVIAAYTLQHGVAPINSDVVYDTDNGTGSGKGGTNDDNHGGFYTIGATSTMTLLNGEYTQMDNCAAVAYPLRVEDQRGDRWCEFGELKGDPTYEIRWCRQLPNAGCGKTVIDNCVLATSGAGEVSGQCAVGYQAGTGPGGGQCSYACSPGGSGKWDTVTDPPTFTNTCSAQKDIMASSTRPVSDYLVRAGGSVFFEGLAKNISKASYEAATGLTMTDLTLALISNGGRAVVEVDLNSDDTFTKHDAFSSPTLGEFLSDAQKVLSYNYQSMPVGVHRYRFSVDDVVSGATPEEYVTPEFDEVNNITSWVPFKAILANLTAPTDINYGESVNIGWNTQGTQGLNCKVTGGSDSWTIDTTAVNTIDSMIKIGPNDPLYVDANNVAAPDPSYDATHDNALLNSTNYTIQCWNAAANSWLLLDRAYIKVHVEPEIWATPRVLRDGEDTLIEWNTHNGDESLCTLTGGQLTTNPLTDDDGGSVDEFGVLIPDDPNAGSLTQTITARSTYSLTCPNRLTVDPNDTVTDTVTVEIVPIGFES